MTIASIASLKGWVQEAGERACRAQKRMKRALKEDSTIVTEMDKEIDLFLYDRISRCFPEANIVTEESKHTWDRKKKYTFAIDPIDGTDGYSQCMPGWCISVGLMDERYQPIAGVVYAPQWEQGGSFLFADVGQKALYNDAPIVERKAPVCLGNQDQMMVGSQNHKKFDFHAFPGKTRSIPSAAMELCAPLMHCAVTGTLVYPCFIWDFLGAHAILKSLDYPIEYWSQGEIKYDALVPDRRSPDHVLAGLPGSLPLFRGVIRELSAKPR